MASPTLEAPVRSLAPDTAAPPVSAPARPRSGRYLSLDLWRGLACLLLVLHHTSFYVPSEFRPRDLATWSVPNLAVKVAQLAWIGVPIFFVVSGYCIAASVDGLQRRPYSLRTFFTRRLRRIYPPLWVACAWVVVVTLLIAALWPTLYERCTQLPRLGSFSLGNWIGNLCASESWQYHLTGARKSYLMSNTWTLCFEEQFYLVSGLLLALAARRFFLGALVVAGLTLASRHVARYFGVDLNGWFLQGHWLLFAAGICLFYLLNYASRRGCAAIYLVYGLGMLYAVLDRSRWAASEMDKHFDEYLFVACGFAVVLVWLRRFDSAWVNARLTQPLFWCGKRSYSIYLTHYPLVVTLACGLHYAGLDTPLLWLMLILPLCLALALVAGLIFYILIERHFLNAPLAEKTC